MENTDPMNSGTATGEPSDVIQDDADQLSQKLAEYENKLGEMRDVLLRERAEIENQRKRLQRDVEQARKFANEVLRPRSLERDRIADPRATFDWDIIREGSRLGFRTLVVDKKLGGHGVDLITQALVIIELAKGDSPMAKTFSQCWKWTHLLQGGCTPEQKQRFLRPFVEDETYLLGQAGTEPNSGSDHRLPRRRTGICSSVRRVTALPGRACTPIRDGLRPRWLRPGRIPPWRAPSGTRRCDLPPRP